MLTEKQQRFADFYCAEPNATKAAEAAGYSPRTAYSQGERLLKNVEIAAYIRDRMEQIANERILSVGRARALLSDIAVSADSAITARLRALDLLLKTAGAQLPPQPVEKTEPMTAVSAEEDAIEPAEAEGFVKIHLPWNGQDDNAVTAVQLPDGSVVPLAGHEDDDLLVYQPLLQPENHEPNEDDELNDDAE